MNNEVKDIIEKAMRDAFEAGYNEGYHDGVHDRNHDGVLYENSTAYILVRNTHWAEYHEKMNTPANQIPPKPAEESPIEILEKAERSLRIYGEHRPHCMKLVDSKYDCTCMLQAALEHLDKAIQPSPTQTESPHSA